MQLEDFGLSVPSYLNEESYRAGFAHGMQSNTLTIFKKSYAEGFRTAKLLCKEIRKQRGTIDFPTKWKFTIKNR